jgi:hypothetical protein
LDNPFDTVGSPYLSEFSSAPYRTVPNRIVPYRTVPQQTVYRSKKYHTIQTELVLKTQFGVKRSVPKMHFLPFFNTKKLYERVPQRYIRAFFRFRTIYGMLRYDTAR